MTSRKKMDPTLTPELEAIARAAAERLRAQAEGDMDPERAQRRTLADAASRAIAAGLPLHAIANAEWIGHVRTQHELGAEILRRVERAERRKRDADREYHEAVLRAVRLGLAQRAVAAAAHVAQATVRAIAARASTSSTEAARSTTTHGMEAAYHQVQSTGSGGLVGASDD